MSAVTEPEAGALPADVLRVAVVIARDGLCGIRAMPAAFRSAPDHVEDATTTSTIAQRIGGSICGAVVAVVIAHAAGTGESALHEAFAVLCLVVVVALLAALALAREQRRPHVVRVDRDVPTDHRSPWTTCRSTYHSFMN